MFLVAPQKAYAQFYGQPSYEFNPVVTTGAVKTSFSSTLTAISNALIKVNTFTSAVADNAMWVNSYVLQPLAYALSGRLMKSITASTIKFVNGISNGTGRSQFVTDYQTSMQMVGDTQALSFFAQFMDNSTSPFASSVTNALRDNYLRNTSRAGFFSSNRNTLPKDIGPFLDGNWSHGGAAAWFALTTQEPNNPYLLYQNSLNRMSSSVVDKQVTRMNELVSGQGFMSWCGGSDPNAYVSLPASDNAGNADYPCTMGADCQSGVCMSGNVEIGKSCTNNNECSKGLTCSANSNKACSNTGSGKCTNKYTSSVAASSGDPCTNADGTAGTIRTPGSVIGDSLKKALGGTQDKLAQMGQMGEEINGILEDVTTVADVANFAQFILGGGAGSAGGILGSGKPSSVNSVSRLAAFSNSNYLGVSESDLSSGIAKTLISNVDMSTRVAQYETAWNAIRSAANTAKTSVMALSTYCDAQGIIAQKPKTVESNGMTGIFSGGPVPIKLIAQSETASTTLKNEILPVIDQAAQASKNIADAKVMVAKVKALKDAIDKANGVLAAYPKADELQAFKNTETGAALVQKLATYTQEYNADMQTLQTMPPTDQDVAEAQQNAKSLTVPVPTFFVSVVQQMLAQQQAAASASATADPYGSLAISGDSITAKMNLINKNAKALKSTCDAQFAFVTDALVDANNRIKQYTSAWNIIRTAATSANTKVTALQNQCLVEKAKMQTRVVVGLGNNDGLEESNIQTINTKRVETNKYTYNNVMLFIKFSTKMADLAVTAIGNEILPVLDQADAATATIAAASTMVADIGARLNYEGTDAYKADVLTLQKMSPTTQDVDNAQQDSLYRNPPLNAQANPDNPLSLSDDSSLPTPSLVDKMVLFGANADYIKNKQAACNTLHMESTMSEWNGLK